METVAKKRRKPRPRRGFTREFKDGVIEAYRQGGMSLPQVAERFEIAESTLRYWLKQAEGGDDDGLSRSERDELAALRRENRQLHQDIEVLKRATAFFAKETR